MHCQNFFLLTIEKVVLKIILDFAADHVEIAVFFSSLLSMAPLARLKRIVRATSEAPHVGVDLLSTWSVTSRVPELISTGVEIRLARHVGQSQRHVRNLGR